MTAFARKVLTELAAPTNASATNNYQVLQEFTNNTDKTGGKVDITLSPSFSMFGRYGWRDVDIFDQPPIPLPSGGSGNAETYVTNKQLAFGATWIDDLADRNALWLVRHDCGEEPGGPRFRVGALGVRHQRAARRLARRRRAADAAHHGLCRSGPAGDQPAVAEYASPWVERDNVLSNFNPSTRSMVIARDGSVEDRSTIKPDRNNVGPRLGFAWTPIERTAVRGGYGVSYVHFHRAGGANVLPINGPQVIPTDPSQPFGNAERNSVRGPLFWQVDLVASKRFTMPWPQGTMEFRAEFFNLLNRTNFRAPNGNRSGAGFGTITAAYDPRQIQLGVKVNF